MITVWITQPSCYTAARCQSLPSHKSRRNKELRDPVNGKLESISSLQTRAAQSTFIISAPLRGAGVCGEPLFFPWPRPPSREPPTLLSASSRARAPLGRHAGRRVKGATVNSGDCPRSPGAIPAPCIWTEVLLGCPVVNAISGSIQETAVP